MSEHIPDFTRCKFFTNLMYCNQCVGYFDENTFDLENKKHNHCRKLPARNELNVVTCELCSCTIRATSMKKHLTTYKHKQSVKKSLKG
jgi:hypothetical protein